MRRKPSAKVASAGVTHTRMAIEDELGWLFREQPTEDYGIDAHAEVVDGEDVGGKLLALQIKGGKSWFKESGPGGWWFRPDAEHVRYWRNHSLPVVVVLYHPGDPHLPLAACQPGDARRDLCWRLLLIPEAQVLDESARAPLQKAAEGDPYELRLRELRLAKPWMDMLANGTRLIVDFEGDGSTRCLDEAQFRSVLTMRTAESRKSWSLGTSWSDRQATPRRCRSSLPGLIPMCTRRHTTMRSTASTRRNARSGTKVTSSLPCHSMRWRCDRVARRLSVRERSRRDRLLPDRTDA